MEAVVLPAPLQPAMIYRVFNLNVFCRNTNFRFSNKVHCKDSNDLRNVQTKRIVFHQTAKNNRSQRIYIEIDAEIKHDCVQSKMFYISYI